MSMERLVEAVERLEQHASEARLIDGLNLLVTEGWELTTSVGWFKRKVRGTRGSQKFSVSVGKNVSNDEALRAVRTAVSLSELKLVVEGLKLLDPPE